MSLLTATKFVQGNWYVVNGKNGKLLDFFIDHNGRRTDDPDPLEMQVTDIELRSFASQIPHLMRAPRWAQ